MSVYVSSYVWKESKQSGTPLLVLLSLAEQANDEGVCWPGKTSLAGRARCSERHLKRVLRDLEEAGELEVEYGVGRNNTNVYGIKGYRDNLKEKGDNLSPLMDWATIKGDIQRKKKGTPTPPEPLLEPSVKDITTERCTNDLLAISKWIKSKAETVVIVDKLRRKFPNADPLRVISDFSFNAEHGSKMKDLPRTLHTYFYNQEQRSQNGKATQPVHRPKRSLNG